MRYKHYVLVLAAIKLMEILGYRAGRQRLTNPIRVGASSVDNNAAVSSVRRVGLNQIDATGGQSTRLSHSAWPAAPAVMSLRPRGGVSGLASSVAAIPASP